MQLIQAFEGKPFGVPSFLFLLESNENIHICLVGQISGSRESLNLSRLNFLKHKSNTDGQECFVCRRYIALDSLV